MGPETAFDVDCIHMRKDFLVEETAGVFVRIGRVPSGKGFLVVKSDRPLDVVAVYTVAVRDIDGTSTTSIDVETVKPHVMKMAMVPGPVTCNTNAACDDGNE